METKNYSIFQYLPENRKISETHAHRISLSIKKHGYIKSRPVIVNEDMFVIDGQHRILACKLLNIPVIYEIEKISNEAIIDLNKTQDTWRLSEYINSHASKGIDCYIFIKNFEEKYKIGISNSISICVKNTGNTTKKIRNGEELKIRNNAEEIINYIKKFKQLYFYLSVRFIRSIVQLFDEGITDKQQNKLFLKHLLIKECSQTSEYKIVFNNILKRK